MRRVVVKASITRVKCRASDAHIRYLQPDGATRDGKRGRLYSAEREVADATRSPNAAARIGISSASPLRRRAATGFPTCEPSPGM